MSRLYPKPGQTVMHCPTCGRFRIWDFTPDNALICTSCSRKVTRAEATGKADVVESDE